MQIQTQIDNLIQNLQNVKASADAGTGEAQTDFENILNATLAELNASEPKSSADDVQLVNTVSASESANGGIPSWVDMDYGYDPSNPRKPNLRELMEALSGQTVEELKADPKTNLNDISHLASELLYGVVNANEDTRDWSSIMSSSDILSAAREATRNIHNPIIDIVSKHSGSGTLVDQVAVLKDANGNILSTLSKDIETARDTLNNYGATSSSVVDDLLLSAKPELLGQDFLEFLTKFQSNVEEKELGQAATISTEDALASLTLT